MAPRRQGGDLTQEQDNEALVLDNLDMSPDDLGMDQVNDEPLDLDDSDQGDDDGVEQRQKPIRFDDEGVDDTREVRRGEDRRERRSQADPRVTHTSLPRAAEVRADGKGNLVNAQGVIVARAGKEARLYQESHTQKARADVAENATREITSRFNELAGHARNLLNEVNSYRTRDQQVQQFGLKPEEQLRAYQMFVEIRDKPEDALRKLLTRASASGIDLTKLGLEGGSGNKALVDLLRGELTQAMEPLRQQQQTEQQRREQEQQAEQHRTRAAQEVESLIASDPEVTQHLPTLLELVKDPRTRGMTVRHLWAELKLNLLQNPQPQQRPNSRRMPSGRSAPVGGDRNTGRGGDELASIDTSYDEIIRDILKPEAA